MAKKKTTGTDVNGTTLPAGVLDFKAPKLKKTQARLKAKMQEGADCFMGSMKEAQAIMPDAMTCDVWAEQNGLTDEGRRWVTLGGMNMGFLIAMTRQCGFTQENSITYWRKWLDGFEKTGL